MDPAKWAEVPKSTFHTWSSCHNWVTEQKNSETQKKLKKAKNKRKQRKRKLKTTKTRNIYSNREMDKSPLDELDNERNFVNDVTDIDKKNSKKHGENTSHECNNG